MKKLISTVVVASVISLAFLAKVAHCAEKPTCAVMTFEAGEGITMAEAKFLSDRFTAQVAQLDQYNVVARSQMFEILRQAEFNLTDHCSATECAVDAGRILQVQYIMFGSVAKMGQLYTLNTSLVEIETARILKTALTDYQGTVEAFAQAAPTENLKTLLNLEHLPHDWARLPVVRKRAIRTGPRLGYSTFTGLVGAEIQIQNIAIGIGYLPSIKNTEFTVGGIRYYFNRDGESPWLGVCHGSGEKPKPRESWNLWGAAGGYRWIGSGGWSLTAGLGIGLGEIEGTDYQEVDPMGGIEAGYSF